MQSDLKSRWLHDRHPEEGEQENYRKCGMLAAHVLNEIIQTGVSAEQVQILLLLSDYSFEDEVKKAMATLNVNIRRVEDSRSLEWERVMVVMGRGNLVE